MPLLRRPAQLPLFTNENISIPGLFSSLWDSARRTIGVDQELNLSRCSHAPRQSVSQSASESRRKKCREALKCHFSNERALTLPEWQPIGYSFGRQSNKQEITDARIYASNTKFLSNLYAKQGPFLTPCPLSWSSYCFNRKLTHPNSLLVRLAPLSLFSIVLNIYLAANKRSFYFAQWSMFFKKGILDTETSRDECRKKWPHSVVLFDYYCDSLILHHILKHIICL